MKDWRPRYRRELRMAAGHHLPRRLRAKWGKSLMERLLDALYRLPPPMPRTLPRPYYEARVLG